MALRALVVGGSVGGLFAALLLRTLGWEVEVFERATDDLAGRGAGIGTRPELFAILKRCGVEVDLSMGVEVFSRKFIERDGRVSGEYPVPSTNSAWDRVYQPLKRTFPAAHFHAGRAVQDIEPGAQSATAIFADGARIAADLIIGADGVHSTVRPRLFPKRSRVTPATTRGAACSMNPRWKAKRMAFCFITWPLPVRKAS